MIYTALTRGIGLVGLIIFGFSYIFFIPCLYLTCLQIAMEVFWYLLYNDPLFSYTIYILGSNTFS